MNFAGEAYYQKKFSGLSLVGEDISARRFEECEFKACSFVDCRFDRCKFLECSFNECILSAIVPMNCYFLEVKFSECKAIGIDWTKSQKLEGLAFTGCQINYSNFKLLKLPKIKILKCEAKEVYFNEADLSGGVFKYTDFEKSLFFKTDLTGADFTAARNYSIDVKNNFIKKARFSLPEALSLLNSLDIVIDGQEKDS
jgi:fluoroquinolone resistance protein